MVLGLTGGHVGVYLLVEALTLSIVHDKLPILPRAWANLALLRLCLSLALVFNQKLISYSLLSISHPDVRYLVSNLPGE
jgi:hypothetical protein